MSHGDTFDVDAERADSITDRLDAIDEQTRAVQDDLRRGELTGAAQETAQRNLEAIRGNVRQVQSLLALFDEFDHEADDEPPIRTDGGQCADITEHGLRRRGWWYKADWRNCPRCRGTGENVECIDDLCHAQDRCMHGDNLCRLCEGEGRITRELENRWYGREGFEPVTIPDADLHVRRKLHAVARERHSDVRGGR